MTVSRNVKIKAIVFITILTFVSCAYLSMVMNINPPVLFFVASLMIIAPLIFGLLLYRNRYLAMFGLSIFATSAISSGYFAVTSVNQVYDFRQECGRRNYDTVSLSFDGPWHCESSTRYTTELDSYMDNNHEGQNSDVGKIVDNIFLLTFVASAALAIINLLVAGVYTLLRLIRRANRKGR